MLHSYSSIVIIHSYSSKVIWGKSVAPMIVMKYVFIQFSCVSKVAKMCCSDLLRDSRAVELLAASGDREGAGSSDGGGSSHCEGGNASCCGACRTGYSERCSSYHFERGVTCGQTCGQGDAVHIFDSGANVTDLQNPSCESITAASKYLTTLTFRSPSLIPNIADQVKFSTLVCLPSSIVH